MLPGFAYVPFGDLSAMREAIDDETCGILVEPVQGEGGINLPPDDYLPGLRQLADDNNLALIFDEVQSGMGRTGQWFAHQHWNVEPDAMTLAKAFASGVAAAGLVAKPHLAEKLVPGTHASTFGGNPLACVAALATIETIEEEGLLERASVLGEKFRARFEAMRESCSFIQDIRIKGVMIGVQLSVDATPLVEMCREKRLLVNVTQGNVLRLLPALTLTNEELDEGCDLLSEVLTNFQSN